MNEVLDSRTFTDARGAERTIRIVNDGKGRPYLVESGGVRSNGNPYGQRYKNLDAAREEFSRLHWWYTSTMYGPLVTCQGCGKRFPADVITIDGYCDACQDGN
jgi:hypothetical protein